jgi:hypothetical protein
MNNTLFGTELGKKYPKKRVAEGICYHGIRLRKDSDPSEDPSASMYSSKNGNKPYIDRKAALEADIVTEEDKPMYSHVGFSQEVPMNQKNYGPYERFHGKSIHDYTLAQNGYATNQPVVSTEGTMYSSANPTSTGSLIPECPTFEVGQVVTYQKKVCTVFLVKPELIMIEDRDRRPIKIEAKDFHLVKGMESKEVNIE